MARKMKKRKPRNTVALAMIIAPRKGGAMQDRRSRRQKDARRIQELFK